MKLTAKNILNQIKYVDNQELIMAAISLLTDDSRIMPASWDGTIVEKMCNRSYKEKLIIANALIAAEIDRINK